VLLALGGTIPSFHCYVSSPLATLFKVFTDDGVAMAHSCEQNPSRKAQLSLSFWTSCRIATAFVTIPMEAASGESPAHAPRRSGRSRRPPRRGLSAYLASMVFYIADWIFLRDRNTLCQIIRIYNAFISCFLQSQ
jgi:hypothetical protein